MPMSYVAIHYDLLEAMESLADDERGRLITAALQYARQEEITTLTGGERYLWPTVRTKIDRDQAKYKSQCETNRRNGKKGGQANARRSVAVGSERQPNAIEGKEDSAGDMVPNSIAPEPPIIQLPLNDGSLYGITSRQVGKWIELYPVVDVLQELRNMYGWLDSSPKRRKTKAGILRFVTGWLAREQDKGGGAKAQRGQTKTVIEQQYNQREYDPVKYTGFTPEEIAEIKKL